MSANIIGRQRFGDSILKDKHIQSQQHMRNGDINLIRHQINLNSNQPNASSKTSVHLYRKYSIIQVIALSSFIQTNT